MAQTSGFDPTTQVKTCFDCKMFDVANWVACLNGENGPGGTPSHEALSVSSQGALEICSVAGQPLFLDRNHFYTPRKVAKSHKCDERCRPSFQRLQHPTLYRRLKRRFGCSLWTNLYKGSVVRQGKKATHKCSRVEGSLSGPLKLQGPVSEPNSVGCNGQLNSGSLHKQTRRNSLSRAVHSPVEDHDMVPSLPDNIESQTHPRVSECDGRPSVQAEPSAVNRMVTASAGVPSDLSKVVDASCRSICHSSEPQKLHWTGLTACAYPPMALLHKVIQKIMQCHCLIILIAPGWPGVPWFWDLAALNRDPTSYSGVNNSSQTVPQLRVPQQSTTSQPPRLVSRSGQFQEQGFSVEVAENCCPSEVINKDHLQVKVGPI